MIKNKIVNIASILALSSGVLMAQATTLYDGGLGGGMRNGTAAAGQLLIPQGAAYLTGGGAVATASGVGASFWNPAGVVRSSSKLETSFSNRTYIADMTVIFAGAAMKSGNNAFSINIRSIDVGDINVTTVFSPDGTGEKFSPSNFTAGLTYSRLMSTKTSMGITINTTSEGFKRVKGTALTIDAGVQYSDFLDVSGLDVGVAVRNYGRPMRYNGSGLLHKAQALDSDRLTQLMKIEAAEADVPMLFEMGASYTIANMISVGGSYESNSFEQDKLKLMGSYSLPGLMTVRAGYLMDMESVEFSDNLLTTTVDESKLEIENIFGGVSFGGSVYLQKMLGINASIDYAYIPAQYFDGNTVFTLNVGF
ncbi:MAG: hypothetical protein ACKVH5_00240 [Fidelibacterota bacterium]|jgi:hypothetical protein